MVTAISYPQQMFETFEVALQALHTHIEDVTPGLLIIPAEQLNSHCTPRYNSCKRLAQVLVLTTLFDYRERKVPV